MTANVIKHIQLHLFGQSCLILIDSSHLLFYTHSVCYFKFQLIFKPAQFNQIFKQYFTDWRGHQEHRQTSGSESGSLLGHFAGRRNSSVGKNC